MKAYCLLRQKLGQLHRPNPANARIKAALRSKDHVAAQADAFFRHQDYLRASPRYGAALLVTVVDHFVNGSIRVDQAGLSKLKAAASHLMSYFAGQYGADGFTYLQIIIEADRPELINTVRWRCSRLALANDF